MSNSKVLLSLLASFIPCEWATCASSYQFFVNKVNTSAGAGNPAANSAWAVIFDENNDSNLPGGLIDGSSLTTANGAVIQSNFGSFTIADGTVLPNGDRILATGTTDSTGLINAILEFNIGAPNAPTPGTRFGVYWFPGKSVGQSLNTSLGSFDIGGFLELAPHTPSGGVRGMVIPPDNVSGDFLAFDSVDGSFPAARLNAVLIPEPTAYALAAFSVVTVLRRNRRA